MLIQADLHTHTVASTHAYSTITENCKAASDAGIKAIAMTDHYIMMPDAPHFWHFENLRVLPRSIFGVTVLKGAEVNIYNYDGDVDMDGKNLSKLEWVVASFHKYTFEKDSPDGKFVPASPEKVTDAYIKLCRNPYIDVIGHPTTDFFPFEYERAVKAFKEYEKLVEINESSIRLKKGSATNAVPLLQACKKYKVPIVVNTDAHFWDAIGVTTVSEKILSDIDFPAELIINSDWERVRERVLKKHPQLSL